MPYRTPIFARPVFNARAPCSTRAPREVSHLGVRASGGGCAGATMFPCVGLGHDRCGWYCVTLYLPGASSCIQLESPEDMCSFPALRGSRPTSVLGCSIRILPLWLVSDLRSECCPLVDSDWSALRKEYRFDTADVVWVSIIFNSVWRRLGTVTCVSE